MNQNKWGAAHLEPDFSDPSDVVLIVNGEFGGNVGARFSPVGLVFDIDKALAEEIVRRWNIVSELEATPKEGNGGG